MTTMSTGPGRPSAPRAENDIYTALAFIAFLFVLAATIWVGYEALDLYGSLLPPGGG